ncbi:MAG: outer membrane protein assembly factor BamD [Gammaproteobacteria bacterium]|nr:outer membrane protein assembly factor BamD [Gammaproteobacteria bacterium]
MSFIQRIVLLVVIAMLSACSNNPQRSQSIIGMDDADKSAATLYQDARNALDRGDYETAIQKLESLEARFPFGKFAQQAQLDKAYSYYKFEEPETAVAQADSFIKLYPRHPRVDYAYYLKGVIRFNQGISAFDEIAKMDPATRDSGTARQAFQYFSELLERFPESPYAQDAAQRMAYLRNSIARSELYSARYYIKMNAYIAAANRAKYIVENLYQTPSLPEALNIMVKAYRKLRLDDLAADAERVLKTNFPKHPQTLALNDSKLFGLNDTGE